MFVITNEHGESTKRPEVELRDKRVTDLIVAFQKLGIFVGHQNVSDLFYVDSSVAIHLPDNSIPSQVFPKLTYPIASNVPLSVSNMVRLALLPLESPLVGKLTVALKHARGVLPNLKIAFPLKTVDANVAENVKRALQGTWETQIASLASGMGVQPEQLLLMRRTNEGDVILSPFGDVSDGIGTLFDEKGLYQGNVEFVYEVVAHGEEWDGMPRFAMDRFREFEDRVVAELTVAGAPNVLPVVTGRFVEMLREGSVNREAVGKLIERILVKLGAPLLSVIAKKMDLGIKNWKELTNWAKSLRKPSILEAGVDFEKDGREALVKLTITLMVLREDFPEMYVNACCRYASFFSEKEFETQSREFGGAIVFAANVVIGTEEVCLILTRGFVYFVKTRLKGEKRYVFLPEAFDSVDFRNADVWFMIPLTMWELVPVPEDRRTTVVLVSENGLLQIQFADGTREAQTMFWIAYTLCKSDVHQKCMVTDLGHAQAIIELSYPRTSNSYLVHASVTLRHHAWEVTIDPDIVTQTVAEAKMRFRLEKVSDISYANLASIYTGLPGFQCRSQEMVSWASVLKAVRATTTHKMLSGDDQVELTHCLFHEMMYSHHLGMVYSGSMLLHLSDFAFAIQIAGAKMLDLQLMKFHSMLPYFSVSGVPLLHYACLTANNAIYIHLILKWMSVTILSSTGRSALFYALDNPTISIAQALIDEGIDIDACEGNGVSPLIYCFQKNDMDNAEFLLRNGAKPHQILRPKYNSALVYAILNQRLDAVSVLIPYCTKEINWPLEDGSFLTHLCLKSNLIEAITLLEGIPWYDPNVYSCYYPPLLQYLLSLYHPKQPDMTQLQKLLSLSRLDLDSVDSSGDSLLSVAVREGWVEIVNMLASDERCNKNHWDKDGRTPLFVAVDKLSKPMVRKLIKTGAVADMPNRDGSTPLYRAVERKSTELVTLLLAGGARPNNWYVDGHLPIHIATPEIKEILKKYGAKEDLPQLEQN